jgi:Sulfotransferase family
MALNIVSGCPRSGTSLCMSILIQALGDKFLFGDKFPQEKQLEQLNKQKTETEDEFKMRIYTMDKLGIIEEQKSRIEHSTKMNPMGFWEDGRISVSGVRYNQRTKDIIKELRENKDNNYLAKIVSQGLMDSDPDLIGKVIFMIRNPYEVAKSQEDLVINGKFSYKGKEIDLFENDKPHSPNMFINVTTRAARFFLENPDLEFEVVEYEDLILNAKETIKKISEFIDEGDFSKGHELIKPELYRSKTYDKKGEIWEEAVKIYELFKERKFQDIIDLEKKGYDKTTKYWFCLRANAQTIDAHCQACFNDGKFLTSIREQATKDNVDWGNLPCVYECGYRNKDIISVEESIKNNHWSS